MTDSADYDRTPHTHGGTDAPECTRYGIKCQPADPKPLPCDCYGGPHGGYTCQWCR